MVCRIWWIEVGFDWFYCYRSSESIEIKFILIMLLEEFRGRMIEVFIGRLEVWYFFSLNFFFMSIMDKRVKFVKVGFVWLIEKYYNFLF